MRSIILKILFKALSVFAILIGLYPLIYFFIDRRFGLLQSKSNALLLNLSWNVGFYLHIALGGVALFIGWTQFVTSWRNKFPKWHRGIGKVYIIACLVSALAGIYIACYATGGIVASSGFMSLGAIWFYTTLKAYVHIRNRQVIKHQQMMIYSYAACCSAITLRIYLPLLIAFFHDFNTAYVIVSWLCWIPNLLIAYLITRRLQNNIEKSSVGLTMERV